MFPLLAMHDLVNSLSVSAKSIRKVYLALTGCVASSDFPNLLVSQKSHAMLGAYHWLKSALLHFVVHVILIGTRKQVRRISTAGHVATVQDVDSFRDRAVVHFPLSTVNHNLFSERARAYVAVTLRANVTSPEPATAFGNTFGTLLKAFSNWDFTRHVYLLSTHKITLKLGE